MTIRLTPKSCNAAKRIKPPRLSASEEGLFKPITAKVSNALSDEYVGQIKAQARADAAKGRYMDGYDSQPRTGFSALRDAQMKELVSPDRDRAIAQVTTALKSRKRRIEPGTDPLLLFDGDSLHRQGVPRPGQRHSGADLQRGRRNDCRIPGSRGLDHRPHNG
mgnify:CR=1 FL=1